MIRIIIGVGILGFVIYFSGNILRNDTKPTIEKNADGGHKIVSVTFVDDNPKASLAKGQIAYIDPETGELTSQPIAEIDSGPPLRKEVNLPPVKVTTYADGTVQADLNGRFRTPLIATIGCDGELKTGHSDHVASEEVECGVEK